MFCVNAFFVTELSLQELWRDVLSVALAGVAAGLAGAALLVTACAADRADELEVAVPFMFVVAAYVAAESVRPEAGLFATTAMGVAVVTSGWSPPEAARLRRAGRRALLGALFVARRPRRRPGADRPRAEALALAAVLALAVRPLVVVLSTLASPATGGTGPSWPACAAASSRPPPRRSTPCASTRSASPPTGWCRSSSRVIALALLYGLGAALAAVAGRGPPEPPGRACSSAGTAGCSGWPPR